MMLVCVSQMQRTIREHKDKGAAGGVFKSYEILEVRVRDHMIYDIMCHVINRLRE